MEELRNLATTVLEEGLAIRKFRQSRAGSDFRFEIELDGLNDPAGAVSVGQCETFSRAFSAAIDRWVEDQSVLKEGELSRLTAENYLLEVSSAGATRELELPAELERFKGMPLKIKYTEEGVYLTELVVFREKTDSRFIFDVFLPKKYRQKTNKNRKQILEIDESDLKKANLYLDV